MHIDEERMGAAYHDNKLQQELGQKPGDYEPFTYPFKEALDAFLILGSFFLAVSVVYSVIEYWSYVQEALRNELSQTLGKVIGGIVLALVSIFLVWMKVYHLMFYGALQLGFGIATIWQSLSKYADDKTVTLLFLFGSVYALVHGLENIIKSGLIIPFLAKEKI